jgi:hypothetical protein
MASPKKPGVAFWTTVMAVVLLAGYPLSLWPALWITSRSDPRYDRILAIYRPIAWAVANLPKPASKFMRQELLWPAFRNHRHDTLVFSGNCVCFPD